MQILSKLVIVNLDKASKSCQQNISELHISTFDTVPMAGTVIGAVAGAGET